MVTDERLRPDQVARRLAAAPELPLAGPGAPRVSCVLVGGDPAATARAIRLFTEQDYPERELVLVLSGGSPGGRVAEQGSGAPVRTVAVPRGTGASAARDAGCAAARGPLIALWESDAWYPAWRLRYQAAALTSTGWELSAAASAVVWDPVAGESWAGDATPWSSPPVLLGATVCLTRQAWVARSLAARGGETAQAGGHFVLGLPRAAFHVPRGVHLAVLVQPGGHQPEAGHAAYPPGSAELLLGAAAALDWGTAPNPAVRRPGPPAEPAPPGNPASPAPGGPGAGRAAPGGPVPDEPAPPRARSVATVALTGTARPLVSCIMPTFNRRCFVEQALRMVARQDYRQLELVVVDDGSEPVEDLLAGLPWARYVRLGERATIGRKRDIACDMARGDVIVQWDDDDWYGPQRVSRQVEDIVRGTADVSGIGINLMLEVRTMQVWSTREQAAAAPRYAPVESLAGGTLAFTRDGWREVGGYPDASVGEDLGLLRRFADAGARIQAVSNRDAYVYIRHGRNSWRFDFTQDDGPAGWRRYGGFGPLTSEDLAFYASLSSTGTLEAADSGVAADPHPTDSDADSDSGSEAPTGNAADAD
ncbi:glycosyltransferase family 2 protein [Kitasatospora sp. NPDC050463]|uniref:glycosyltransferase family 2 protein n=1 Tax=Kitasatospora sp. NPDC050463 TaxID=3155786 RepID=UPI0033D903D3